jgi:hypothetical protein
MARLLKILVVLLVPTCLLGGCVHRHRYAEVVYVPENYHAPLVYRGARDCAAWWPTESKLGTLCASCGGSHF